MTWPLRAEFPVHFINDLILQKGRKKNVVRGVAIYLSSDLTGKRGVDFGKNFGNISSVGTMVRYNHLTEQLQRNNKLRWRIKWVKKR